MEALDIRLRRRIDVLADALEQANQEIARLRESQRVRVRHRNRTCIYCGVPVSKNARTCANHKELLALDPEFA